MANSGWVRIKAPASVTVQLGINSGNTHTLSPPLVPLSGGNIFSAWVKDADGDLDTVFYLANRTTADLSVDMKWMAGNGTPGANVAVPVPANELVQRTARSDSGL